MDNKTYVVDIDNTICKTVNGDYARATPLKRRIKKLNKLFDKGNTIIYWTARGDMVKIDWSDLTKEQLKNWGCKYHRLLTKVYGDYYIDDHAINSNDFF